MPRLGLPGTQSKSLSNGMDNVHGTGVGSGNLIIEETRESQGKVHSGEEWWSGWFRILWDAELLPSR